MADLGVTNSEIEIDEEASEVMASVNAVMLALAEACPDGSGKERAIDFHAALLALNGATTILLSSAPPSFRESEMEMFIEALRHGRDVYGAKVKLEGGNA